MRYNTSTYLLRENKTSLNVVCAGKYLCYQNMFIILFTSSIEEEMQFMESFSDSFFDMKVETCNNV